MISAYEMERVRDIIHRVGTVDSDEAFLIGVIARLERALSHHRLDFDLLPRDAQARFACDAPM
jgi:hypothetical protein